MQADGRGHPRAGRRRAEDTLPAAGILRRAESRGYGHWFRAACRGVVAWGAYFTAWRNTFKPDGEALTVVRDWPKGLRTATSSSSR